jgi:ankyrin repeat protein
MDVLSVIQSGHTDVFKQLLDEGLDPDTIIRVERPILGTVDYLPILYLAVRYKREDIARLLLKKGANPNIERPDGGNTPIFLAGNSNITDLLIQYGANVDHKNNRGDTALSENAYLGLTSRIKLLVSRGADVNTKDNDGKTPLMKAAASSLNKDTIILLLKLGADPDVKDNFGNKASDYISHKDKKFALQMSEKRFSKKIFPSKHGRVTENWMEICNTLGNAGLYELRKLIMDNVDRYNFDTVTRFYKGTLTSDYNEFLDYIQGLSKREICAGLAKYYTSVKPAGLTREFERVSVRPLSEMARKSIQNKRKKASLYSLAYRKARQTDPEKFREYVSQFDLPRR